MLHEMVELFKLDRFIGDPYRMALATRISCSARNGRLVFDLPGICDEWLFCRCLFHVANHCPTFRNGLQILLFKMDEVINIDVLLLLNVKLSLSIELRQILVIWFGWFLFLSTIETNGDLASIRNLKIAFIEGRIPLAMHMATFFDNFCGVFNFSLASDCIWYHRRLVERHKASSVSNMADGWRISGCHQ